MNHHFFKRALFALMAAFAAMFSGGAISSPTTYGNTVTPVYFGSGNVNGNWTIGTENGIELALRAKDRATLATIDGSSGVYTANGGLCNPTCTGGPKANWNYEFSVNSNVGSLPGGLTLNDLIVQLWVDTDPGPGQTWNIIDMYANWGDNEYSSNPGVSKHSGTAPSAGDIAVQQSSNPLFANSGFNFLPSGGQYSFILKAFDKSSESRLLLASVGMEVDVIPEPASLALFTSALAMLIWQRRQSKKSGGNTAPSTGGMIAA